jgi:Methyltransferase domain
MTSTNEKRTGSISLTAGEKLLAIYEESGFDVHTGWNSCFLDNWREAQGTYLKKDGHQLITRGGGISWHEIPCFELLSYCFTPERILVIGNSFGWSTLLVSLLWPNAQVVAMDIGVQPPADVAQKLLAAIVERLRGDEPPLDAKPTYGIELTNDLAAKHHLKAKAVLSESPQDVGWVVEKHLGGPPDFVFIDGYHIPRQVLLDFDACSKVAAQNCVYLFHDVINFGLRDAFETCQRKSGLLGGILWRTPSGMGLLYPQAMADLKRVFRALGDNEAELKIVKANLARFKRAAWFERAVCQSRFLKRIKDALIRGDRSSPSSGPSQ